MLIRTYQPHATAELLASPSLSQRRQSYDLLHDCIDSTLPKSFGRGLTVRMY